MKVSMASPDYCKKSPLIPPSRHYTLYFCQSPKTIVARSRPELWNNAASIHIIRFQTRPIPNTRWAHVDVWNTHLGLFTLQIYEIYQQSECLYKNMYSRKHVNSKFCEQNFCYSSRSLHMVCMERYVHKCTRGKILIICIQKTNKKKVLLPCTNRHKLEPVLAIKWAGQLIK